MLRHTAFFLTVTHFCLTRPLPVMLLFDPLQPPPERNVSSSHTRCDFKTSHHWRAWKPGAPFPSTPVSSIQRRHTRYVSRQGRGYAPWGCSRQQATSKEHASDRQDWTVGQNMGFTSTGGQTQHDYRSYVRSHAGLTCLSRGWSHGYGIRACENARGETG